MRRGRLGDSTGVWEIAGTAVVLRAGVHGCGCFCAAIGSDWVVRGDAGNWLSFCMWVGMVAAFAFELRRILGRTVRIFRQNRAKKPNFSVKAGIFGGNRAGMGRNCAVVGE